MNWGTGWKEIYKAHSGDKNDGEWPTAPNLSSCQHDKEQREGKSSKYLGSVTGSAGNIKQEPMNYFTHLK